MRLFIVTQAVDRTDPALGFFHAWVEEFAKHAEHVIVVGLRVGEHQLPQNVSVLSLGKEEQLGRLTYLRRFFAYLWTYRREYDSVFVHMNPEYVVLGGVLWRLMGKHIGLWYAHGATSLMLRVASWLAHVVFTSTPEGFRIPSAKVRVVGQGIDTERFAATALPSRTGDDVHLLVVGRISPIKRCEVAINAAARLAKLGKRVSLTFLGAPLGPEGLSYRRTLDALVRGHGLEDAVTFAGAVAPEEVVHYLSKADYLLNPSATGSLDKVGLEALAAGVPILTSNEAFAELLGESREQLMFPEGDALALAERIMSLEETPLPAESFSELTKRVRREHSIEALIPRILETYGSELTARAEDFYAGEVDARFGPDYESERWHRDALSQALYEMTGESIGALLLAGEVRFSSCLELGPGAGTWSKLLVSAAPDASYDLLDISENMLTKARESLAPLRVEARYLQSDFADFVPDRTYDLFFSVRALEYVEDKRSAIGLIASLLSSGGTGFIITKTPHYTRARLAGHRYSRLHRGQIEPRALARLAEDAGLVDIELYPVTLTFPIFKNAYLYRALFRLFGLRPLNILSEFFSESYAIRFRKP